jgi:hypothetical protein
LANWVRTYVDKIDTLLKADFNTELVAIDSALTTVPDAQIFKSFQPFHQNHPLIQQYLVGDSPYDESTVSHWMTIKWNHYTGVRVVDHQPSESIGNEIHSYIEALQKAIYKGNASPGKLDNVSGICYTRPVSWVVNQELGEGFIVKEGGILWEIAQDVQLNE